MMPATPALAEDRATMDKAVQQLVHKFERSSVTCAVPVAPFQPGLGTSSACMPATPALGAHRAAMAKAACMVPPIPSEARSLMDHGPGANHEALGRRPAYAGTPLGLDVHGLAEIELSARVGDNGSDERVLEDEGYRLIFESGGGELLHDEDNAVGSLGASITDDSNKFQSVGSLIVDCGSHIDWDDDELSRHTFGRSNCEDSRPSSPLLDPAEGMDSDVDPWHCMETTTTTAAP